jgi:4-diphosphocytidyl-2-C-methyl-D-erythritol kinase
MSRSLVLRPSAKINLTLRVGPARADGFHDVRSVMQSIALSDTLTLSTRKGPFVLATRAPGVPADRTNLVWRAAEVLWRALRRPGDPSDTHVKLEKQIPSAAGLGGGSADAAAALAGLNRLWGGKLSQRDLIRLAAELGSDVPFFLLGGTALAAGRGEELYPLADVPRLGVVIIKPSFGVQTAEAYRWLDEDRAAETASSGPAPAELEVGWPQATVSLVNDLEPPVARRHPGIQEIVKACREAGALGAAMTGSGSAVFAIFPESAGQRAVRRLKLLNRSDWLVLLTRTLSRREAGRRVGL